MDTSDGMEFGPGDRAVVIGETIKFGLGAFTPWPQAIIPSSGTSLFADLWVVPSGAQGGHMQVRCRGPLWHTFHSLIPAWN